MNKRLLILGATARQSEFFGRENGLSPREYKIVMHPTDLKGYHGETDLIILMGWTETRHAGMLQKFEEELYWFKKTNTVKHMHDTELISEYKDEV